MLENSIKNTYLQYTVLFLINISFVFPQKLKFEYVPLDKGFSQKTINCIVQDSRGYLWIGTLNGLYKYDGFNFTIYKHDISNKYSLSDDNINSVYEDRSGRIWIATNDGGLNRYDRALDMFVSYQHNPDNPNSISDNRVYRVCADKNGFLWIGTGRGGLNRFDHTTNVFTHYKHDPNNPNTIGDNDVRFMYIDSTGIIWLATEHGGLNRFDPVSEKFFHYIYRSNDNNSISSNRIIALYADRSKTLWISTDEGMNILNLKSGKLSKFLSPTGKPWITNNQDVQSIFEDRTGQYWFGTDIGLFQYNPKQAKIVLHKHDPMDANSLSYNCIISIYEDHAGTLWFGSWEGGLNKFNPETNLFGHIRHNFGDKYSLSDNRVNVIFQDNSGKLWIGTEGGALNLLLHEDNISFKKFRAQPRIPHGLGYCSISTLCQDRNGILLVGTTEDGLASFNPKTGHFTWFEPDKYEFNAFHIKALYKDNTGTIWIGMRAGGVCYYNPVTGSMGQIKYRPGEPESLSADYVYTVFEDKKGTIWVGTDGGLDRITMTGGPGQDRRVINISHYTPDADNEYSLSNNDVCVIHEDFSGILWIGTDYGLNKFNREYGTFTHYFEKDGLPSNVIAGILEDDNGKLWISTSNGIACFNPETGNFRNYDISDGLQGNNFRQGAYYKSHDGMMYFGGTNGFNRFLPKNIRDHSIKPKIVITDFRIFNRSVKIGEKIHGQAVLVKSISETDTLKLSYNSRVFSFEFSALDFQAPEKNQYAYMLEGFENEWTYSGSRRFASYTNIDGGTYIFRVKAANKDGVWNQEGVSLHIIIHPPWWKTIWAYLLYLFGIGGLIYGIFRFQLYRERVKKDIEIKQMETNKLQELDRMKSHFFANISHEFRTPLTLILGSAKRLLSGEVKGDTKSQYKMQIRNGERLLTLVSQLLDLSKLESGKLILQAQKTDLVPFIKRILSSFQSYAIEHRISLHFTSDIDNAFIYFDTDKMEKILTNLLSNAFKFTADRGRIEITASFRGSGLPEPVYDKDKLESSALPRTKNDKNLQITISDTGIGIAPVHIPHIFERFYQAGNNYVREQQGSGIGLALTKELVKLHYGEIWVKSEQGKGTTFTILFPIGKDHLQPSELTEEPAPDVKQGDIEEIDSPPIASPETVDPEALPKKDAISILIVEDDKDMRGYISEVLSPWYQIMEAVHGDQGFEKATENIPELIISDVMMPRMDGFRLCDKLKTDERTSHIPIVLLTAKSSGEDKIEGLVQGADDYLIKPFDPAELRIRVKNLIEQRRKLRERFSREVKLQPSEIAITPTDEAFLKRAIQTVERQMDNPDMSIEWFSKEMGLSRSQLHRKFQALINQSASEFIRSIRLKRAIQLLEQHAANVSEIAYQVGFNSPDYFRKCFREQFGVSPLEYVSNNSGE